MNQLVIYTDGAFSSSRKQGGVGIVFLLNGEKLRSYSRSFVNTTNNKMELTAVIIALQSILKSNLSYPIIIRSDSQYVIGCASKGWKRKKNLRLWKKYDEVEKLVKDRGIEFSYEWVHGHNNDKYNDLADRLAVEATHEVKE